QMDFARFFAAYEELIRKVRANDLTPDDFSGTTVSLTNPGMIGTVQSVPRLMAGQAAIIGVGAIGYPAEFEGSDERTLAEIGVGKVVTLTSTYDHRVIQGAESGEFLRRIHQLLLGENGFYDEIFGSMRVPYVPVRWRADVNPSQDTHEWEEKQAKVLQLINLYRVRGHLIAPLDPLQAEPPSMHPELDPATYGLTIWDLDREFVTGGLAGRKRATLGEILRILRDAYCRAATVEYMHIQEPDQKQWIQERIEGVSDDVPPEMRRRILRKLNEAEAFEKFLHQKFVGHKRFSLEGAESLIPMLDVVLEEAAEHGLLEAVIGMSHRGRLNVLANTVRKSYAQIFREFEGDIDPDAPQGSGDVKYHMGATGTHTSRSGNSMVVTVASNPSHLEAVDPVVEGMVRAKQDFYDRGREFPVLSVLIHGDAAFAGQGVVAETLNLSQLSGYRTGGTVHIIVNNQLGFTTGWNMARSSTYASDVAKMVQAPIFHVNGDDPEACVRVALLALEFRQQFNKDVVIDMWCYRRWGHNEADDPSMTQPLMYARIENRRSVRKLYTEALVNRGDMSIEEAEAFLEEFQDELKRAFDQTRQGSSTPTIEWKRPVSIASLPPVETAVEPAALKTVIEALSTVPPGFNLHKRLTKWLSARATAFDSDAIDWALGEALAFGTLLLEGRTVRLSGEDSRRGTFSQRHAVLVDQVTGDEYLPLANIPNAPGRFYAYDSLLSEFAVMGFEYGYSVSRPEALVLWEAQFGDFVNGAQVIIDQFLGAAEDKWGQTCRLVLLLPHGYEGQGPEHSSARPERFLEAASEDNMQVVVPSTPAQYFHVLRRQAMLAVPKPLVLLTPKSLLRLPAARSAAVEFTTGSFQKVLADPTPPESVKRVIMCQGKVWYDLAERRAEQSIQNVELVRVEQLYPLPAEELRALFDRVGPDTELYWVQEEPENMGALRFVERCFRRSLGREIIGVSRETSASPATGSLKIHQHEQAALLEAAFAGL
ncbi:MAG TPA: multifunctional oxoglutarate decarboxylase/oxoglutarate dehydrogenase thiamine pyrophosphate-binding subunit/dihydrolipoyllysine-residue succinyltransferase subunit, partial [Actinomycetota bacterium]|nr:multifunctional oxoglutarate decarboxylase/oxoglutarate dehydrogenase thiamine pyrophosphate-binding subunit/dihydrolipoyllysine-residue succinyltransferase subunit [Actinomycetota bacterium]